jgi:hypothetical protein
MVDRVVVLDQTAVQERLEPVLRDKVILVALVFTIQPMITDQQVAVVVQVRQVLVDRQVHRAMEVLDLLQV